MPSNRAASGVQGVRGRSAGQLQEELGHHPTRAGPLAQAVLAQRHSWSGPLLVMVGWL